MAEPAPRVVIIEDDRQIRRFVRSALEEEGCQVFEAENAARGLIEAGTRKPDLVVLDLGLPDRDGVEVVRDLRGWTGIPIIILSARSAEDEKIAALDAGADDYLTKPFGVGELLARVRALLRRRFAATAGAEPVCSFGEIRVNLSRATRRTQWRGAASDADRVSSARRAAGKFRQGADAQATATGSVGTERGGEQSLSTNLRRPFAPETGSRSDPTEAHTDRDWHRLSISDVATGLAGPR